MEKLKTFEQFLNSKKGLNVSEAKMEKLKTFEEFVNEFEINESKIGDDTKELAEDLVNKGIAPFAQRTSTGRGSKGKFIIKLATLGKSYDELKKDIENNYRKMDISTSLSSNYYYSPLHKLYFYFYKNDRIDKSFKPKIDKMITWDYYILTLRKIPKI